MPDKEKKLNIEHAPWLLEARAKSQRLLLRLYILGQENANANLLQGDSKRQSLFAMFVGAAFSLWRAAFLCDTKQNWEVNFQGANYLLVKLIEDNSVNFSADQQSQEWMGGYYLNNAMFRLLWVRAKLQNLAPETKDDPALIALDALENSDWSGGIELNKNSKKIWNDLINALEVMVDWLKVPKVKQPRRGSRP
ncbi:MAG: hypothetical protein HOP22_06065 [Nitrospiraceae bacterium]|nr:hypothetical protein [Nitrospiraceae bacterium]